MTAIEQYERRWQRAPGNNFAVACYDQNAISELSAAHSAADADETDCEAWGLTPEEWYDAIEAALLDRVAALESRP